LNGGRRFPLFVGHFFENEFLSFFKSPSQLHDHLGQILFICLFFQTFTIKSKQSSILSIPSFSSFQVEKDLNPKKGLGNLQNFFFQKNQEAILYEKASTVLLLPLLLPSFQDTVLSTDTRIKRRAEDHEDNPTKKNKEIPHHCNNARVETRTRFAVKS
jgi:hypothetical protein